MTGNGSLLLIRYGEIGLKGRNRAQFVNTLVKNLRHHVGRYVSGATVTHTYGRIYLEWDGGNEKSVHKAVSRTFGVVSFSPAVRISQDAEKLRETALTTLKEALQPQMTTFKVNARRSDKRFAMDSMEINRTVGAYLLENAGRRLTVDVHNPDVAVNIEVRSEGILVYSRSIPGLGGLPVGSGSTALLLLSGGIDSPVAGWYALKRGLRLQAVHFHSYPFTSERSLQKVRDLAAVMAEYAGPIPLHIVHFTEIQRALQKHVPDAYGITIMRRFMLRIAAAISVKQSALALITGESVGQVASQTLESMQVINEVTNMPILRPLIGFDKMEIIDDAQRIGTYELSILPYEDCCTLFVPANPQTRPKLHNVLRVEQPLDVQSLVDDAVAATVMEIIQPDDAAREM